MKIVKDNAKFQTSFH